MITLGITTMSAGSVTEPGGYADIRTKEKQNNNQTNEHQFSVNDNRTPQQLIQQIREQNYTEI